MSYASHCSAPAGICASKNRAFVGLGSNKGDSLLILEKAREKLAALPGLQLAAVSSVYRTEPQGFAEQPFFLNQVIGIDCDAAMTPEGLLESLLAVESELGRDRTGEVRYGPRFVDLDLLLFGNERMDTEYLTLPHPRMFSRAFVLVPLAEIAPGLCLPQGISVTEALSRIRYSRKGDILLQPSGV